MAKSSSRRALLGTALAAAGTVAVSAPALAAVSPDAALLRACAAFHAIWDQRERVWAVGGSDAEAEPLTYRIGDLAADIARLRAASDHGKEAKAHVVSLLAPRAADGTVLSDGITQDVLWSLVADLTGKPHIIAAPVATAALAPATASPNRDAELIALCEEYVALDREFCRLAHEDGPLLPGDPRSDEIGEQQDVIVDRHRELEEEIAGWTAETPEGLRALVQAARHTLSSDADRGAVDLLEGTAVTWQVMESVVAMLDAGRLA